MRGYPRANVIHTLIATRAVRDGVRLHMIDVSRVAEIHRSENVIISLVVTGIIFNHATQGRVETVLLQEIARDFIVCAARGGLIAIVGVVSLHKMYMSLHGRLNSFARHVGLPQSVEGTVQLIIFQERLGREQNMIVKGTQTGPAVELGDIRGGQDAVDLSVFALRVEDHLLLEFLNIEFFVIVIRDVVYGSIVAVRVTSTTLLAFIAFVIG
jgi:hypothetical protein